MNRPLNRMIFTDIEPPKSSPLPFPLENIEDELSEIYVKLQNVYRRLKITYDSNVRNSNRGIQHDIKKLRYKLSTCLILLKQFSKDVNKLRLF